MDAHSLDLLELPAVRSRVADATAFAGGRLLAEAMGPSSALDEVVRRAGETEEAMALMGRQVSGPRGARDLRPLLPDAVRGLVLEADELYDLRETLGVALGVRGHVIAQREFAPGLAEAADTIEFGVLGTLESELERSVGPGGEVLDTASPELSELRRRTSTARSNAQRLVGDLAKRFADHLQESFTTSRAGRPVLAVKASSKGAVSGIVHDRSASGETLFVEPLDLVEQNNLAAELEAQKRDEIDRILRMLSGRVGAHADAIDHMTAVLAQIDFAIARAEVSQGWSGCRVEIGDRVAVEGARHPLLDPKTVVPVDIDLGEFQALVVSGPNTGGKTVALKTLGLMAAIHQCGLRVPARHAWLPVFDALLVDIGDEQSIAQSLSTFSGHVTRLRQVVELAGDRSLALLDEVASGTDPSEGSALAQALIEYLIGRGIRVVTTTHHAELKEWAAGHDRVANAAVGVDPESLEPTYELRVGEPGASHALTVASRFGLSEAIVGRASDLVDPGRRQVERLLADADSARVAATEALVAAETKRAEADELKRQAEERAAELQRQIARNKQSAEAERHAARQEVERKLSAATDQLAELRREIASAKKQESRRRNTKERARESQRDRHLGAADSAATAAREVLARAQAVPTGPVAIGDRVIDSSLGMRGTVTDIEGDTAVLTAGSNRMRMPVARLVKDGAPAPPEPSAPPLPPARATTPATGTNELDLRGQRAEEAQRLTRAHVDQASLSGLARVRVIHGKGTGALRKAVREEMERHPLVERIETAPPNEGGDGATLIYLDASAAD